MLAVRARRVLLCPLWIEREVHGCAAVTAEDMPFLIGRQRWATHLTVGRAAADLRQPGPGQGRQLALELGLVDGQLRRLVRRESGFGRRFRLLGSTAAATVAHEESRSASDQGEHQRTGDQDPVGPFGLRGHRSDPPATGGGDRIEGRDRCGSGGSVRGVRGGGDRPRQRRCGRGRDRLGGPRYRLPEETGAMCIAQGSCGMGTPNSGATAADFGGPLTCCGTPDTGGAASGDAEAGGAEAGGAEAGGTELGGAETGRSGTGW